MDSVYERLNHHERGIREKFKQDAPQSFKEKMAYPKRPTLIQPIAIPVPPPERALSPELIFEMSLPSPSPLKMSFAHNALPFAVPQKTVSPPSDQRFLYRFPVYSARRRRLSQSARSPAACTTTCLRRTIEDVRARKATAVIKIIGFAPDDDSSLVAPNPPAPQESALSKTSPAYAPFSLPLRTSAPYDSPWTKRPDIAPVSRAWDTSAPPVEHKISAWALDDADLFGAARVDSEMHEDAQLERISRYPC
ncbi:hypothetical protein FISHEDRAFT_56192 [Fistulina hepatica ATCC 64428]|uniref:Uncharacterized protein n=1 Tax=Fistulina hepatica ATCC 64428 TaxID=1128425 RepID=A0A0D7AL05_9AGAR|nr:hypothetical protein FISHEDRAFT_56192 [Fistulina hepatica ATCC 64428]